MKEAKYRPSAGRVQRKKMAETIETVVIGAGVVGLSCARMLARSGREVLIIEKHNSFGTEISSRNSEVIHAGIYYPNGSKKAALCLRGKDLLYDFCEEYQVPYKKIGKLIVATTLGQLPHLENVRKYAAGNGVADLMFLSADEVKQYEAEIDCVGALLSPSTGIIDSHVFMLALLGDAERHGAMLALGSQVVGGRVEPEGIFLEVSGAEQITVRAKNVINAAGLGATFVAKLIHGSPNTNVPDNFYAKGNYFSLSGKAPFSRLIYPLPEPGGLGVHLTLDLAGQAKFGPDVEWVDEIDYKVDPSRSQKFYDAIRTYWPLLKDDSLIPAYAGIRPKIVGPGASDADFMIQTDKDHGVKGLVNLFGIESPGLTASLAIAEHVNSLVQN
jgi:L-2-hydroxyglutarate oxidase LhgO